MQDSRTASIDRRLGARIAFGPRPTPEFTEYLEGVGYEWLVDADRPMQVRAGGLLTRLAVLERSLAGREAA